MVNRPTDDPSHNLGLDLVRATEAAALTAGQWVGRGHRLRADTATTEKMHAALNPVDIQAAVGEEARVCARDSLRSGQCVGTVDGASVDIVVDSIDGRDLVAHGYPGAIPVMAVALRGTLWAPKPGIYMEKIVVSVEAGGALVPECLDAPAAWTLVPAARAKNKGFEDLTVFVLDRPRHMGIIWEIRAVGAHVLLRNEGDVTGALLDGLPDNSVDLLMGIGGS